MCRACEITESIGQRQQEVNMRFQQLGCEQRLGRKTEADRCEHRIMELAQEMCSLVREREQFIKENGDVSDPESGSIHFMRGH